VSTPPTKREIEAAFGQRVYEYQDDEGVVYYSFTRAPTVVSPPKRLYLQSRVGTHIINFLTKLRRLGEALKVTDEEDG